MLWFEKLMSFREGSPEQVRANAKVDGERITSLVSGKQYHFGRLEIPSLAELRARVQAKRPSTGNTTIREIVANVQRLHTNIRNAGAIFQVASQFNLLEMVSPEVTPESGVGRYEGDHTQGPACAVACGAGTIYRNYFVPVRSQIGQSEINQIDCLEEIGKYLENKNGRLWKMRNGYALATEEGLIEITQRLLESSEAERDQLRSLLRVGLQWDTQVTLDNCQHHVSQVYCSAMPVAYSRHSPELGESFARLILEGAYEATFCAAILNKRQTGNNNLFLTLLGGGAFGNRLTWIIPAIERSLDLYKKYGLNVAIVSYRSSNPAVQHLLATS